MKRIIPILSAISLLAFPSCQKVIDINLADAEPQYVIEGAVTNAPGPYTVRVSRTAEATKDNGYPPVTNAVVVITDDAGNSDTLTQSTPGSYLTHAIQGTPGRTYTIKVFVDGQAFYSSSTMPRPVKADSIYILKERGMGGEAVSAVVAFRDEKDVRNFYRFSVYRNDRQTARLYLFDDQFDDGRLVKQSLSNMDSTYKGGDIIRIEMQGISEEVYRYYYSLEQTLHQSSATPANPVKVFKGGNVLGYFSAHTVDQRRIALP
jgi:hypothetical protein